MASASLAFAATGALAAAPSSDALGCLIKPSRIVELGSPVVGVIDTLHVDRGDMVTPQQRVATLRDSVERAAVAVAKTRASAEAERDGAARNLDLLRRKLARTEDLARQGFISAQAVEQVVAELEAAQSRSAQAEETLQQARKEVQVVNAQLDYRTIRSPIAGVVIDVYRHAGERVEDKPIAKIATIDPLYVELVLPATHYGQLTRGASVSVQPSLPGMAAAMAKVDVVDPVIDPGSNTLRVRLLLPNPQARIPAGIRCRVELTASGDKGSQVQPPPAALRSSSPAQVLGGASAAGLAKQVLARIGP